MFVCMYAHLNVQCNFPLSIDFWSSVHCNQNYDNFLQIKYAHNSAVTCKHTRPIAELCKDIHIYTYICMRVECPSAANRTHYTLQAFTSSWHPVTLVSKSCMIRFPATDIAVVIVVCSLWLRLLRVSWPQSHKINVIYTVFVCMYVCHTFRLTEVDLDGFRKYSNYMCMYIYQHKCSFVFKYIGFPLNSCY